MRVISMEEVFNKSKRSKSTEKFLKEYKKEQEKRSDLQKEEHRNDLKDAFGEGKTIVNVLTGEKIEL